VLAADGWASDAIVTSDELDLNWQGVSVGVVVDMAVMSMAEVFVGNGVSTTLLLCDAQLLNLMCSSRAYRVT
jgi:hypothetical protein